MEEIERRLGQFRVLLTLCNRLCPPIFFHGKLMALACSILGTFYVMKRMASGSTILLLFFGSLYLEALAFYIISIEKPARIPGICDRIKRRCLRLLCQGPRGGRDELLASGAQAKNNAGACGSGNGISSHWKHVIRCFHWFLPQRSHFFDSCLLKILILAA